MTPDEIRRSWDDDDTPRSVFPEPLAERLTRENKELRAENERLRDLYRDASVRLDEQRSMTDAAETKLDAVRLTRDYFGEQAVANGEQLDALVADLHELANDPKVYAGSIRDRLRAVLDKHAGEQP
jgi:hypothetical protein